MARGTLKNLKRTRPSTNVKGQSPDQDGSGANGVVGTNQNQHDTHSSGDTHDPLNWLNCECFFSIILVALLAALPFNLQSTDLYQTRESYVTRAEELFSEGSFEKAASLYERAVNADETADGHVFLAETLVRVGGRTEDAVRHYRRAADLYGDEREKVSALVSMGKLQAEVLGRPDLAAYAFHQVLSMQQFAPVGGNSISGVGGHADEFPEIADAHLQVALSLLGTMPYASGSFAGTSIASAYSRNVLTQSFSPPNPMLVSNYGPPAEISLHAASSSPSSSSSRGAGAGVGHASSPSTSTMDVSAAMGHLEAATSLSPSQGLAHLALGHCLRDTGQPEKAIAKYKKAIKYRPRDFAGLSAMGMAHHEMGSFKHALSVYRKALGVNPAALDMKYAIAFLQGNPWPPTSSGSSSSSSSCSSSSGGGGGGGMGRRGAPPAYVSRVFDLEARRASYVRWALRQHQQQQQHQRLAPLPVVGASNNMTTSGQEGAASSTSREESAGGDPPRPEEEATSCGCSPDNSTSLFSEVHGLVFRNLSSAMRPMVEQVLGLSPAPPPDSLSTATRLSTPHPCPCDATPPGHNQSSPSSSSSSSSSSPAGWTTKASGEGGEESAWVWGDQWVWGEQWLDVLDLGCGRGTSGLEFRGHANRLTGMDLSALALKETRSFLPGLYDETLHADFVAELAYSFPCDSLPTPDTKRTESTKHRHEHDESSRQRPPPRSGDEDDTTAPKHHHHRLWPESMDLVVAVDSIPYVGDLAELFCAVESLLRPGGAFAFNVDLATQEAPTSTGPELQFTGRWRHPQSYIEDLAKEAGLKIAATQVLYAPSVFAQPHGPGSPILRRATNPGVSHENRFSRGLIAVLLKQPI